MVLGLILEVGVEDDHHVLLGSLLIFQMVHCIPQHHISIEDFAEE